jgi:hypothetical protein
MFGGGEGFSSGLEMRNMKAAVYSREPGKK